ncbi:MAG TPA: sugar phosphate nucleotidyltransferase [Steroidobacteraceae bacterium]|nr:sugar phosphate nucleotidyltransferase [Steroidobacteraceae bacterium]
MGNEMHEAFTVTSLQECYGCVDWFPYYRHVEVAPPGPAVPPVAPGSGVAVERSVPVNNAHLWALVLAGGDGTRLSDLTIRADGGPVPKQYCSLRGGPSLLEETLRRAANVALPEHISLIVAAQHRRWWSPAQLSLPASRVVVQPRNRGTANGILLQMLHVMRVDPDAQLVILPSDHFVADEQILAQAICSAESSLLTTPEQIILLGMQPSFPDADLGYICPGARDGRGTFAIAGFVEKPSAERALQLIERGALWSAFIIAARCSTLLGLYERRFPQIVRAMGQALGDKTNPTARVAELYEKLPTLDFSRDVLELADLRQLRVLAVRGCGWSDLGTPERVGQTLARFSRGGGQTLRSASAGAPPNLAHLYRLPPAASASVTRSWRSH